MPYDILVGNYMTYCELLNFQANNGVVLLVSAWKCPDREVFYRLHVTIMGPCQICTYDSICIMIYSLKIHRVNRNNPLINLH